MNDQQPVVKIYHYILWIILASYGGIQVVNGGSHLDTHANIIVFGMHCYVLANLGLTAEVNVLVMKLLVCTVFQLLILSYYMNVHTWGRFLFLWEEMCCMPLQWNIISYHPSL